MKHLKSFFVLIIAVILVGKIIPAKASDVVGNLAQLISPTDTPTPQTTPSAESSPTPSSPPLPTQTVSPSVPPSQQLTPTIVPTTSITGEISPTTLPTGMLSPTKTASPSVTITQKPAENAGGTNIVIPSPTPNTDSPTATPTDVPSPTIAPLISANTPPPVQKAAEQIFKKVVVPPLSFLLQRPQEDFYKENQITKPTSYGLMAFSAFGMISGIYLLFPSQIYGFYKRGKNKLMGLFSTNSNNLSVID